MSEVTCVLPMLVTDSFCDALCAQMSRFSKAADMQSKYLQTVRSRFAKLRSELH